MKKKYNYALLGKGKTGKHLTNLIDDKNKENNYVNEILHIDYTVFDRSNPPSLESLKDFDAIISFFPGEVFLEYIPVFIASKLPVVVGSTGFSWPKEINANLKNHGLKWIWSHNFALGMNLVRNLVENLASAENLFPTVDFKISETHHTNKLDAPSGTALSLQNWLQESLQSKSHLNEIESIREGDVVGIHKLEVDTPFEKITLIHEAKNRQIFAEGALWATNKLLLDKNIEYGLNSFSDIALKGLR